MSTLKVNKIRDTAGSTDAITFDPSGGAVLAGVTTISTARVTTGITTTATITTGTITTGTITTAKVTTLQDASGNNSSTPEQIEQGRAKAWVIFQGDTNTGGNCDIRDSYNVSSVTDEGTGDYTVNFTSGVLSNANYCITGSISWSSGSRNILSVASETGSDSVAPTTTALRLESVNYGNGNQYDADYVSIAVFGG